jgi:hypothetical protein
LSFFGPSGTKVPDNSGLLDLAQLLIPADVRLDGGLQRHLESFSEVCQTLSPLNTADGIISVITECAVRRKRKGSDRDLGLPIQTDRRHCFTLERETVASTIAIRCIDPSVSQILGKHPVCLPSSLAQRAASAMITSSIKLEDLVILAMQQHQFFSRSCKIPV